MIRFIIQLILVVAINYGLQGILPWWGVFISTALATALVYNKALSSFFAGFVGLGSLWFLMAFVIDNGNQSVLSSKVASLLSLSTSMQLILITALLGAIIGGLSGLTGNYFSALFIKEKSRY